MSADVIRVILLIGSYAHHYEYFKKKFQRKANLFVVLFYYLAINSKRYQL